MLPVAGMLKIALLFFAPIPQEEKRPVFIGRYNVNGSLTIFNREENGVYVSADGENLPVSLSSRIIAGEFSLTRYFCSDEQAPPEP